MPSFEAAFVEDPIWDAVDRAKAALELISSTDAEVEAVEHQQRLRRAVEFIDGRLRASDPTLVGSNVLGALSASLEAVRVELEGYRETLNLRHLANAQSHIDHAIPTASQLPVPVGNVAEIQQVQTAASSYRRSVGQLARQATDDLQKVREVSAQLQREIDAQAARITQQAARIDDVVAQAQTQFAAVHTQAQSEIATAITELRSQATSASTTAAADVESAVTAAQAQLTATLTEARAAADAATQAIQESGRSALDAVEEEAAEHVKRLETLLAQAVKTVGAIGSTGMSAGYQQAADKENGAADRLRFVAIVALAIAGVVSVSGVVTSLIWDFDWELLFQKTFSALPLLLLAGYAASESGKHREQARISRQIELQLASLDSYIALFEDSEKNATKKRLAHRFFGFVPSRGDQPPEIAAEEAT
jgi:hypothetical protein